MNTAATTYGEGTSYTIVILDGLMDLSRLKTEMLACGYSPAWMANYPMAFTQPEPTLAQARALQTLSFQFTRPEQEKRPPSLLLAQ